MEDKIEKKIREEELLKMFIDKGYIYDTLQRSFMKIINTINKKLIINENMKYFIFHEHTESPLLGNSKSREISLQLKNEYKHLFRGSGILESKLNLHTGINIGKEFYISVTYKFYEYDINDIHIMIKFNLNEIINHRSYLKFIKTRQLNIDKIIYTFMSKNKESLELISNSIYKEIDHMVNWNLE